ncbi:MAG: FAD/NAD(P)-binding oxidoreductase [Armatimonadota bacterium]|nr:FAD/NAD(P)-binding oxidoreductase [Armatimonadota bacterium]MDR7402580.1 FAD/NAD(P)-binding oxidoreductase [Armatimonadota bacterium]MDR7404053.1 FAD/NAD(P)-binding oxidoreductase [Armatimonadota bacterium]MDR7436818.1 FAD/NAD(P)-binding oxidoreductase [Armatimonadota bacterium]MDR7472765.1 FAD/NAD(P)-binding oxidoreductase [Armatimonadota bacterium]
MGRRIVILGGGFGGVTAALSLRGALGSEHTITLVDRRGEFMMGLRTLWVLVGRATRQEGTRPLTALSARGVDVRRTTVRGIDLRTRTVATDEAPLPFDYLVVALGADPRPDLIAGWSPAACNLYDAEDVERIVPRIRGLREGRVHVAVLGVPYKCPPAPYEAALLLDDLFRRRGLRDGVEIQTSTVQPMSLPAAGPAACAQVEGQLSRQGIGFAPNRRPVRLEGTTVVYDSGRAEADVLLAVPPHRPPAVVADSGLALRGEWVQVDPGTLRTSADGVFAVGDVVDIPLPTGLSLPKAGVFAEAQARVVAGQIVAEITGARPPAPFDGYGYCFIEMGGERAAMVRGTFYASPAPRLEVAPPSAEAYRQKVEFERERLARWFGS